MLWRREKSLTYRESNPAHPDLRLLLYRLSYPGSVIGYIIDGGFGLDVGFIDHFNTQFVITLNYSAIANLHTLQNHAKSFPVRGVFTSNCLVTASDYGCSSASGLKSSLNGSSLPTELFLLQLSL
jgi:hypothetical protein